MRKAHLIIYMLLAYMGLQAQDNQRLTTNYKKWQQLSTDVLVDMGSYYMDKRNMPDSALLCYTIAANRYYKGEPAGEELWNQTFAICFLGALYLHDYHDLFKAHAHLLQAKEIAEKNNWGPILSYALMDMGNLYAKESSLQLHPDLSKTIQYTKQAFHLIVKEKNWHTLQPLYAVLTINALIENKLPDIRNEITIYNNLNIPDTICMRAYVLRLHQGMQHYLEGNIDKAIEEFKSTEDYIDNRMSRLSQKNWVVNTKDALFNVYARTNRDEEALKELREMERITTQNYLPERLTDVYRYYHEFYKSRRKTDLADVYELKWLRYRDSTIIKTRLLETDKAEFLFEIGKMNEQMKELAYKKQMQQRILWMVSAFTILAIVMIILLIISRRRLLDNNRMLYQKNLELLAADEERKRKEEELKRTEAEVTQEKTTQEKYSHNQMDDDVQEELLAQILHLMETSDEIYKESFCIEQLAELLGSKKNYVSQAINAKGGQTFSTLLNDYRLKEACRRMNNQAQYGHFSIEGIGLSVGYSSRSHFARLFKQFTGLTPSAYQKLAKEKTV